MGPVPVVGPLWLPHTVEAPSYAVHCAGCLRGHDLGSKTGRVPKEPSVLSLWQKLGNASSDISKRISSIMLKMETTLFPTNMGLARLCQISNKLSMKEEVWREHSYFGQSHVVLPWSRYVGKWNDIELLVFLVFYLWSSGIPGVCHHDWFIWC